MNIKKLVHVTGLEVFLLCLAIRCQFSDAKDVNIFFFRGAFPPNFQNLATLT